MPFELTITEPVKIVCDTYEELQDWLKAIQNVIKPAKTVPVKAETTKPAVKEITRVVKPKAPLQKGKSEAYLYGSAWFRDAIIDLVQKQICFTGHDIKKMVSDRGNVATDTHVWQAVNYIKSLSEWSHNGEIIGCYVTKVQGNGAKYHNSFTPYRMDGLKKIHATKHYNFNNPIKGGKPVFNIKDPAANWDERIEAGIQA